jgi:hypothetical protein
MSEYSITLPDTQDPKEYARVGDATRFADRQAVELHRELKVVHTATGAVVHVATFVPAEQEHFNPWERVEVTPRVDGTPDFEGYVPAYHRKRIPAVVYRPLEKGAEWLVWDGRSTNSVLVPNTREACTLTREMRQGKVL